MRLPQPLAGSSVLDSRPPAAQIDGCGINLEPAFSGALQQLETQESPCAEPATDVVARSSEKGKETAGTAAGSDVGLCTGVAPKQPVQQRIDLRGGAIKAADNPWARKPTAEELDARRVRGEFTHRARKTNQVFEAKPDVATAAFGRLSKKETQANKMVDNTIIAADETGRAVRKAVDEEEQRGGKGVAPTAATGAAALYLVQIRSFSLGRLDAQLAGIKSGVLFTGAQDLHLSDKERSNAHDALATTVRVIASTPLRVVQTGSGRELHAQTCAGCRLASPIQLMGEGDTITFGSCMCLLLQNAYEEDWPNPEDRYEGGNKSSTCWHQLRKQELLQSPTPQRRIAAAAAAAAAEPFVPFPVGETSFEMSPLSEAHRRRLAEQVTAVVRRKMDTCLCHRLTGDVDCGFESVSHDPPITGRHRPRVAEFVGTLAHIAGPLALMTRKLGTAVAAQMQTTLPVTGGKGGRMFNPAVVLNGLLQDDLAPFHFFPGDLHVRSPNSIAPPDTPLVSGGFQGPRYAWFKVV